MASGHVNRIKRPNTWLQRPMLQNREESSCQTGAVHTWHLSDVPPHADDVRWWGQSGPRARVRRGLNLIQPGHRSRPTALCRKPLPAPFHSTKLSRSALAGAFSVLFCPTSLRGMC